MPAAVPLEELAAAHASTLLSSRVIPCDQLLADYPTVQVNDQGLAYVSNGRDLGPAQLSGPLPATPASWVRVKDAHGTLVALATPDARSGVLHPSIVLLS
jgi:tRNA U55 pseudouridine synthase TruB